MITDVLRYSKTFHDPHPTTTPETRPTPFYTLNSGFTEVVFRHYFPQSPLFILSRPVFNSIIVVTPVSLNGLFTGSPVHSRVVKYIIYPSHGKGSWKKKLILDGCKSTGWIGGWGPIYICIIMFESDLINNEYLTVKVSYDRTISVDIYQLDFLGLEL